jgi:hypothetical protein
MKAFIHEKKKKKKKIFKMKDFKGGKTSNTHVATYDNL